MLGDWIGMVLPILFLIACDSFSETLIYEHDGSVKAGFAIPSLDRIMKTGTD